ncbi:hypothetical protein B0O80DRAFT_428800 [Mortierella sp. GBAus27b]|nr:hypothetical protein B0O80DRAFT_428800 [Mortierella sp. GBAus27b]
MLILRHCYLSSEDLITCERALIRFVAGRAKPVNLDFNVWDYTLPEIYGYILGMFVKLDLVDCLGISTDELLDFIIDVDHGYQATFYHSFYHAADVTAVLYHMLDGMTASQYLSKPDMAALLLAGLCHDIGHPGLNNLYQLNAKTELLKEFGEASVLEKYSCSLAMNLVTKHSLFCNIEKSPLAVLPEGQPATDASMRDSMVKAILATDMTFHYNMLNNLNNLVEETTGTPSSSESEPEDDAEESSAASSTPSSIQETPVTSGPRPKSKTVSMASPLVQSTTSETLESESRTRSRSSSCGSSHSRSSVSSSDAEPLASPRSPKDPLMFAPEDLTLEQRQNFCNCLLHAADISNAVKPWVVCKRWSDLVVQEFFRQGDIEKAQNLSVSPNMDRNQHNQPQISLGFGDYVVQPYFEALVDLLPEADPLLKSLASNREQWVALQKSSQQYGHDPYLAVDPLEDPNTPSGPSSPGLPPMLSGRRVSGIQFVLLGLGRKYELQQIDVGVS